LNVTCLVTPWSRLLGWPLSPHDVLVSPFVALKSHGMRSAMWSLCSWCIGSLLTPLVVATAAKATPGLAPWYCCFPCSGTLGCRCCCCLFIQLQLQLMLRCCCIGHDTPCLTGFAPALWSHPWLHLFSVCALVLMLQTPVLPVVLPCWHLTPGQCGHCPC
jgi:hypothetical protein